MYNDAYKIIKILTPAVCIVILNDGKRDNLDFDAC